ncbi:MAG: primosomal protein N' [Bacteroidia bacterium]|nr:primosomal protein N' [Bacteroidia bacterium]
MAEELFSTGGRTTLFAEVLLPVPIPKYFTYRVPHQFNDGVLPGKRVIVQFGDRKILTGIVVNVHEQPPKDYEAKYILELLDEFASLEGVQLKLFQWIADYYMCTEGEVMNAALPAGLKLSSESMVQLHPNFNLDESDHAFSDKELTLIKHLESDAMSYSDISKLLGVKHIYGLLKSLAGKEAIILFEEVVDKYRPKTEKYVRLSGSYTTEDSLETLFENLSAKPKQEAMLLAYLQHVPVNRLAELNKAGVRKSLLVHADVSASSIQTLVKNGVLDEFDVTVPRFAFEDVITTTDVALSEEQLRVQREILEAYNTHAITLLHGVTGSGKTEVYINLIRRALDGGAQVLYLLPEIALTTQIVQRLRKIFGDTLGVYHSKFSDNERVEVWNGVLSGKLKFVIGVRSSIFLPFDNLGLIIVDEEHDPSYKQQEPAPRYNARDVAMMLGQLHHAKVLLGSATPSIETYFHAKQQRYGLVTLPVRYGEAQLPEILFADLGREKKMKTMKGEFSGLLLQEIGHSLANDEQVIIFQNRRGYSPTVTCEDCGWVPKCVNCSVSLTYHQYKHSLVCHYCNYRENLPQQCPVCSSNRIKTVGYGTEKLEEELQLHFPDVAIGRMDFDTTRTKTNYEKIIEHFQRGETRILVGTQMVTKGLDFDHVSLVGIFNADKMIHFPDFRAYERGYQLITQVSGRAGRRSKPGKVVIQTAHPEHTLLQTVVQHNYDQFFEQQLDDRHRHHYPPFTRLIEVTVKHTDKKKSRDGAMELAYKLRERLVDVAVLGPAEPIIGKIRNQYLMSMMLKIPRGSNQLKAIKHDLHLTIAELLQDKNFRNSRVVVDVDPL